MSARSRRPTIVAVSMLASTQKLHKASVVQATMNPEVQNYVDLPGSYMVPREGFQVSRVRHSTNKVLAARPVDKRNVP